MSTRRRSFVIVAVVISVLTALIVAALLLWPADDESESRPLEQQARRHERGDGAELDHRRAAQLYKEACELGSASACGHLGRLLWDGARTGAKDADEPDTDGFAMLNRGCDGGDGRACAYLVFNHYRPQNRKNQPKRAFELAKRACEAKSGLGCDLLAELSFEHVPDFTAAQAQPLWQQAETLLRAECEAGELDSCRRLGVTLSQTLYRDASPTSALRALTQACELGDPQSCKSLTGALATGRYGAVDLERAVDAEAKAKLAEQRYCDAGASGSCLSLAQRGYLEADPGALAAAAKACDAGMPLGCYYAAFESGPVGGIAALNHLEAACADRDPAACFDLAAHRVTPQGITELSAQLLIRACELGQLSACRALLSPSLQSWAAHGRAGLTLIGSRSSHRCRAGSTSACMIAVSIERQLTRAIGEQGVQASNRAKLDLARTLASTDCERDLATGCRSAGIALQISPGARPEAARQASDKACTLGDARACSSLALEFRMDAPASAAKYRMRTRELIGAGCNAGWLPACQDLREMNRPRAPPPPGPRPPRRPAP